MSERETTAIDYHALLCRYIAYVRDVEGADFIDPSDRRYMSAVKFTPEEWAELERLGREPAK